MKFHRMVRERNSYYITQKRKFSVLGKFTENELKDAFLFAYGMTYGKSGEHRDHRSGGKERREPNQIFIDAFQGKLGEIALKNELEKNDLSPEDIDFNRWELGIWDEADVVVEKIKINVKSAKFFANLLLLEVRDWNEEGEYIPNLNKKQASYDYFVLVRIKPSVTDIFKDVLDEAFLQKDEMFGKISTQVWTYDIPGAVNRNEIKYIINNSYVIPQNCQLNGSVKMDADNYYVQSGDMHSVKQLLKSVKYKVDNTFAS